jgi:hypothetical protein
MEEFLEMILIPEAEIQQDLQSTYNDVAFVFETSIPHLENTWVCIQSCVTLRLISSCLKWQINAY